MFMLFDYSKYSLTINIGMDCHLISKELLMKVDEHLYHPEIYHFRFIFFHSHLLILKINLALYLIFPIQFFLIYHC